MTEETVLTPQLLAIIASGMSLLSLVVSSIHCVCACKNPDYNFRLRFGSQSTVATVNDTTTSHDAANGVTTMRS